MTPMEADAAIRDAGLAWEILDGGVVDATQVKVPAFSEHCNAIACGTYADAANAKAKTAAELAEILRLHVGDPKTDPPTPGDSTELRALLSA